METRHYLGIHIGKESATVVCLDAQQKDGKVVGCFSVSLEGKQDANPHALAGLVAQGCAERNWDRSDVAVALDCATYMQHDVHSEFTDSRKIAATVRFDTEEALSTDATGMAIAFRMDAHGEHGSDLTVFTVQKNVLSEMLISLQSHGIDPVTVEPDVISLSTFLAGKVSPTQAGPGRTLFALLSMRGGYLVLSGRQTDQGTPMAPMVRTFLVAPSQNRSQAITREVMMTTALGRSGQPINRIAVFDGAGAVDCQQLGQRTGIETSSIDLLQSVQIDADQMSRCGDAVGFAIAYGAALATFEKEHAANFRNDFMPYQGKKRRLEQALKYFSVAVIVLLISVALYFQTQLFGWNKYRRQLHNKLAQDYSAVMGVKSLPDRTSVNSKLAAEVRRLHDAKAGVLTASGEKSIPSKLSLVLDVFNKCASETNLKIESISITNQSISVNASTSSRRNTLKVFETAKANGLDVVQERFDPEPGIDKFIISLAPKQ